MKTIVRIFQVVFMASVLIFSSAASARQVEPVVNLIDQSALAASGKALSVAEVQQLISRVAQEKKWIVTPSQEGKITASFSWNGNKHTIVVEIACQADRYSITYKDSVNMKYGLFNGVPSIHPHFNRFIGELRDAVRVELMKY